MAVMGPAGKEFVYKPELRSIRSTAAAREKAGEDPAQVAAWLKAEEGKLNLRYERELMNPREALSLGSISRLVMPNDLRRELAREVDFLMRHYTPSAMVGVQREFH